MSSPISPLTDQIDRMRQMGGRAVNMIGHPLQSLHSMMSPAPPPQDTSWHDQMVQQANQSHANAQQPQQGVLTQAARRPRP